MVAKSRFLIGGFFAGETVLGVVRLSVVILMEWLPTVREQSHCSDIFHGMACMLGAFSHARFRYSIPGNNRDQFHFRIGGKQMSTKLLRHGRFYSRRNK